MRAKKKRVSLYILILPMLLCCKPVAAQKSSVSINRHARPIPKACEAVVPASIDPIDIPALLKEADCKGSGDMLADYTYVMTSTGRTKDKNGHTREVSTTYEVFIPTFKSGTGGKGILLVTHRDGVAIPADELEKARLEAGKRLEKAEEKNANEKPSQPDPATDVKGMLPLGMYVTSTTNHNSTFGKSVSAALSIHTFLKTCELTFSRREQHEGRETLIFNFTPRPDAQFRDNQKYIAQLAGEIWIDAQDRIVVRLSGRPALSPDKTNPAQAIPAPSDAPPAVYEEMMRLPEGVWLPRIIRINGDDYLRLFPGITSEAITTFSNYFRFSTEIKDVKLNTDGKP